MQEALAGKSYHKCHVAVVFTNSTFTSSAIDLAERTDVVLWDRRELRRLVKNYLSVKQ